MDAPISPQATDGEENMERSRIGWTALLTGAACVLALVAPRLATADRPNVSDSDVVSTSDGSVMGTSRLVRRDSGVNLRVHTTGLEPGAYTVWFLVFNNPGGCVDPANCGADAADFEPGGPAGFGFTRATGGIVGPRGEATFAGNLLAGEILMDDAFEPIAFDDPQAAEIQVIVRYHGPADPGEIFDQTHTLQPELGVGPDVDVQFAVHPAP
jgi:hypothetical protein